MNINKTEFSLPGMHNLSNETDLNTTVHNRKTFNDCSSTLLTGLDYVLVISLPVFMIGMGCTVEIKKLIAHLKRPFGPAIGMLSQFVVLPLSMFGLAHALMLDNFSAISLIVLGATPGGTLSNLFTYWVDGDVSLSLAMTVMSNTFGLGLMPLNIWIYSRSWTSDALIVPYKKILVSLAITFVSASVGIFVRWKWENKAHIFVKIGSVFGAICIVVTCILVTVCKSFIFQSTWKTFAASALITPLGILFGYIVAIVFRMSHAHARTIALETGVQNLPLALAVISLSFSRNHAQKMVLIPFLAGFYLLLTSVIFVGGYFILKNILHVHNKHKNTKCIHVKEKDNETKVDEQLLQINNTLSQDA